MSSAERRALLAVLFLYGVASLVHFIHNAEFLHAYPGLPASWTRGGVYFTWLGMTTIGVCGWWLVSGGRRVAGALLLMLYALFGLDSLGHYVFAPFSAHTAAMNLTILVEVAAAALVFAQAVRLFLRARAERHQLKSAAR